MRSTLVAISLGVLAIVARVSVAAPPETEARPVTDELHGVQIVDPYRWLEGDNADPERMGKMTDEVAAWTDAQNVYTRSVLDGERSGLGFLKSHRDRLEARLRELFQVGSVSAPQMAGSRYFYSKREGSQAQPVVYVREKADGEPRELLNPNTLDASGLLTISWYEPNQDGSLLAFGMFRAGDENSTLYILDVASGEWLADEIPGKVNMGGWMPDGRSFFYERLADLDNPYSGRIKFHRVGTHHRQDPEVISQEGFIERYKESGRYGDAAIKELASTYGPFGYPSEDGRWLVLGYYTGTRSNDLWVADLSKYERTGELDMQPVLANTYETGAEGSGPIVGDVLYLQTTLDAPNGRVLAVDLNEPEQANWKELVPNRADTVIESTSLARGMFTMTVMRDATNRIELYAMDGEKKGELELPGIGSAGLATDRDRSEAYLTFSSYNEPRSIYRVDLATHERSLWERPTVPVDPSIVEVKQVRYPSKDGTEVTMFIVHKKGLELNGKNPTILYGYGGFNVPMTPYFSSTMFPWYENGGVYAVANLRGGGEYGEAWHRGGMLANKQNVFDDFIAAGEWLIANGYTDPTHLGVVGGSNGGLLTGAVVTQRPDLFAAAISAVPLLDMVRYQDFLMGRYWIPEYGSSEDAEQFNFIRAYSPYHNVKPGTKYPAMLVTAGENDARVHPMHARKMVALLQAATASDPETDPILLWVDRDSGHGRGKPMHLQIRDTADQRLFMMWQLGMINPS